MTVTYHVGDTREVIKTIADGSVDFIGSSPPFLALRSYVPADHESKGDEIGSERNPAEFIDMLLGLTAEWGRVLAPHGSIAIELGDTYSGASEGDAKVRQFGFTSGQRSERPDGFRRGEAVTAPMNGGTGWPRAKSLALIPQLYAVALAYGINPLTGQPSPAGRWLVRNVVVWHRPNPAVGRLGDKVRPSTSYIVVATRSAKRWFDLTAVRQPLADSPGNRYVRKVSAGDIDGRENATIGIDRETNKITKAYDPSASAGAPPLDAWFDQYDTSSTSPTTRTRLGEAFISGVAGDSDAMYQAFRDWFDEQEDPGDPYDGSHDTWTLTTQPSRLAHYAMWPAKLAERLILMMCPREVCRVCGEPRRRIEGVAEYLRTDSDIVPARLAQTNGHRLANGVNQHHTSDGANTSVIRSAPTLGWTDCGHDNYRPGHVLDPFGGSGTTGATADLHGRDATLIDFDARNKAIYPARYDEVKRALYGTPAPMPGQETFDFEVTA